MSKMKQGCVQSAIQDIFVCAFSATVATTDSVRYCKLVSWMFFAPLPIRLFRWLLALIIDVWGCLHLERLHAPLI